MEQQSKRHIGRPRSGESRLSADDILDAALAQVDADGAEALTMRRLASRLGVDAMALYTYFPNKRALIAALIRRVFSAMRRPSAVAGGDWQAFVRAFGKAYRAATTAHPGLLAYLVTHADDAAVGMVEAGEVLYAALTAAGFPPGEVMLAADVIIDYLNGFVLGEREQPLGREGDRRAAVALLARLPEGTAPTIRRVLGSVPPADQRGDPEAGLEIIIAGLAARQRDAGWRGETS